MLNPEYQCTSKIFFKDGLYCVPGIKIIKLRIILISNTELFASVLSTIANDTAIWRSPWPLVRPVQPFSCTYLPFWHTCLPGYLIHRKRSDQYKHVCRSVPTLSWIVQCWGRIVKLIEFRPLRWYWNVHIALLSIHSIVKRKSGGILNRQYSSYGIMERIQCN